MNHSIISTYRKELMGFATLWIVLLHSSMWFSTAVLEGFKEIGHCGVDIFLFLSAFGMYYAYQKGERGLQFYKRRAIRILPAFLVIALFRCIYLKYSLTDLLLLLSTLSFWVSYDRSMWYISALVVLYAITPLYLAYFTKGKQVQKTVVTIVISIVLGLLFHNQQVMVFFARLPIFFLGFYAGKLSHEKVSIGKSVWIWALLCLVISIIWMVVARQYDVNENILWGWGMFWYPNFLATWPICLFLSAFFQKLESLHFPCLCQCLGKIGEVSLEFYLLFEVLLKFFSNIFIVAQRYDYHSILFNLLVIFLTYWIALLIHTILAKIFHSKAVKES